MKLIQNFGALTINSSLSAEQLNKAKRYAPESLTLFDDKKPVFAITTGATGSVNKHGIVFSNIAADQTMFVTLPCDMPSTMSTDERKALLEQEYGMIMFNLNKVEAQVVAAIGTADAAIATVAESIVIQ